MNPSKYSAKILEFKLKFSPSPIGTKALPQTDIFRPSQTLHSSNCYEPDDCSKASSSGTSFPKGTNSGAQTDQCFICGRLGHHGSNNLFTTMEKGIRIGGLYCAPCIPHQSAQTMQTPHGLCVDSVWTGRLPIWHRSLHNRCFESVWTLWTVLRIGPAEIHFLGLGQTRTEIQFIQTPLIA
jgi:hypothetical protein